MSSPRDEKEMTVSACQDRDLVLDCVRSWEFRHISRLLYQLCYRRCQKIIIFPNPIFKV